MGTGQNIGIKQADCSVFSPFFEEIHFSLIQKLETSACWNSRQKVCENFVSNPIYIPPNVYDILWK